MLKLSFVCGSVAMDRHAANIPYDNAEIMSVLFAGLPPDSLTVDQDRLYWTNDAQQVMMSVDKRTGLDLVTDETSSPVKNILAFGDNLQPLPGLFIKHEAMKPFYKSLTSGFKFKVYVLAKTSLPKLSTVSLVTIF
jgi:hypothetical protein